MRLLRTTDDAASCCALGVSPPWTLVRAGAALLVRNPEIWLDGRPSVFWLRRFLVSSVGPRTPHSGTPPLASPSASPAHCESARFGGCPITARGGALNGLEASGGSPRGLQASKTGDDFSSQRRMKPIVEHNQKLGRAPLTARCFASGLLDFKTHRAARKRRGTHFPTHSTLRAALPPQKWPASLNPKQSPPS